MMDLFSYLMDLTSYLPDEQASGFRESGMADKLETVRNEVHRYGGLEKVLARPAAPRPEAVITSYSIHYTKLYEVHKGSASFESASLRGG